MIPLPFASHRKREFERLHRIASVSQRAPVGRPSGFALAFSSTGANFETKLCAHYGTCARAQLFVPLISVLHAAVVWRLGCRSAAAAARSARTHERIRAHTSIVNYVYAGANFAVDTRTSAVRRTIVNITYAHELGVMQNVFAFEFQFTTFSWRVAFAIITHSFRAYNYEQFCCQLTFSGWSKVTSTYISRIMLRVHAHKK